IALIDGNINAQGSDITKTGGFVETSGHDLFINDDAIVDAKEWLLDPDEVTISTALAGRSDPQEDDEYTSEINDSSSTVERKKNKSDIRTLTNSTLERILSRGAHVNITATKKINVTSDINIGGSGHLTLYREKNKDRNNGVTIDGNITSNGGSLTINSDSWVDIHKNITLGSGFLNITTNDSVGIEGKGSLKSRSAASAHITAQGTIKLTGENKSFRLNNISLNGTGNGLSVISTAGNLSHKLDGEINISGNVTINQTSSTSFWKASYDSEWNVSTLNVQEGANFTFIKFTGKNWGVTPSGSRRYAGVNFRGLSNNMTFNVASGANVTFKLKPSEFDYERGFTPYQFTANITATGGGSVLFDMYANHTGRGATLEMKEINVSGNTNLTFNSHSRKYDAFKIKKDLTINATGSSFNLLQTKDNFEDGYPNKAINSTSNITILGGRVALGGHNSSSNITGNITIRQSANVELVAHNGYAHTNKGPRALNLGNLTVEGELSLVGASANIGGNLSVKKDAKFKGETQDNLNITGAFTNNGTSIIDVKKGVVNIQGDITNKGGLNITTNAQNNQKTIINGNITNEGRDLNIKDNKANAEIQIGGNISQKEGNLTISSDKVNITKQITIKAGVDEGGSDSSPASNANLTIKTKTLELTGDLNISGFNKAEITAKNGNDLTIGKASDGNANANAKKVTFDKVKDSKISAKGHGVTLNSKVESSGDSSTENGSDGNNIGLTISAKDVTVNSNITSHKTVNISASEGGITTKAGTTINATTGSVEVTAKTGDIKGGIESTSGSVTLTATGDALTVSNVTAKDSVTVKAEQGTLTTTSGGTIKSEENKVELTAQSGSISGNVEGKNQVNITASTGDLTIGNSAKVDAKNGAATLTAESGKLTTQKSSSITSSNGQTTLTAKDSSIAGSINAANVTLNTTGTLTTVASSNIKATSGTLAINAKDAKLNGTASGDHTVVNATNASGSGSVTAVISSDVNITGDLSTINGLNIISKNGRNTVVLKGTEIDVKYIQPGVASANEVIEAKRVLEKVKDLSDEERETLAKLGVSAVRFVEPNNTITVNTQNEFTTRPSSQVTISEGKACFSSGNGAAVCTNITDGGQQ
ncbi:adhesin, partial [Haemophilus influenzae]